MYRVNLPRPLLSKVGNKPYATQEDYDDPIKPSQPSAEDFTRSPVSSSDEEEALRMAEKLDIPSSFKSAPSLDPSRKSTSKIIRDFNKPQPLPARTSSRTAQNGTAERRGSLDKSSARSTSSKETTSDYMSTESVLWAAKKRKQGNTTYSGRSNPNIHATQKPTVETSKKNGEKSNWLLISI
jgi:hypothetical protein